MKDTTNHEVLAKAHENLSNDLASISQLIEPVNDRALAMLYKAQPRLEDIEELAKFANKAKPVENIDDADTSKGLVGLFPDDTLSHVSDTLLVLSHVDYEDCRSSNEFTCGMVQILNCAMEALDYEVGRVETLRKTAPAA